jgi:hypothetical protein
VEHEGTFVDYYCHRFDARRRRIRAITERAAKKQLAPGGAKSEQSEFFVSAVGVLFDTVFAEFDAVCPEHPVSAFRDITTANDDEPIGPGHGQQ